MGKYLEDQDMPLAYHHHMGTVIETEDDTKRLLENTSDQVKLILLIMLALVIKLNMVNFQIFTMLVLTICLLMTKQLKCMFMMKIKGIQEDLYLSSFGQDGLGELYLLNHTGHIYKITDAKK